MANFFELPADRPTAELFETLLQQDFLKIERIISTGQTTPVGQWYDQAQDEWVLLLQGIARLSFADRPAQTLQAGDYLYIPAHQRHRVEFTSTEPPCIWLAMHFSPTRTMR
jgi:cupin 2 domain-containing protein